MKKVIGFLIPIMEVVITRIRSLAVAALFSVLYIASAHATLITETWTSTITDLNHTAFAVGDTFVWTVTYDDASLRMHVYSDGPNGIAEFGEVDDSITDTSCTGAASNGAGCTDNYSTEYILFADAAIDLSAFYSTMQAAGLTGTDVYGTNYSRRWIEASPLEDIVDLQMDDFLFQARTPSLGGAETRYDPDTTNVPAAITFFTSSITAVTAAVVPEPATIILMGVGLVGLGFSRRRRVKRVAA